MTAPHAISTPLPPTLIYPRQPIDEACIPISAPSASFGVIPPLDILPALVLPCNGLFVFDLSKNLT